MMNPLNVKKIFEMAKLLRISWICAVLMTVKILYMMV